MTIKEEIMKEFEKRFSYEYQYPNSERGEIIEGDWDCNKFPYSGLDLVDFHDEVYDDIKQFLSDSIDRVEKAKENEWVIIPLASPQLACSKQMLRKLNINL